MLAGKVYSGRLVRPALFGGSPEWTAGVRRHPTAVVAAAVVLLVCACIPYAGFPALYLAAAACGADGLIIEVHNDPSHALCDGAQSITPAQFDALAKKYHFSLSTPFKDLSKEVKKIIFYGTEGEKLELHYDQPRGKGVLYQVFEGICNNVERRYQETQSDASKRELEELIF